MSITSDANDTASLPMFPPVRPSSCPFDPPAEFADWRSDEGLRRCRWRGAPCQLGFADAETGISFAYLTNGYPLTGYDYSINGVNRIISISSLANDMG